MQKISPALKRRRRSGATVIQQFGSNSGDARRTAAATGVMLLGAGTGEQFPSLDSVPSTYHIETNSELLYRLCVTLIERKLVADTLWLESGRIPIVFARNAVEKIIDQICGDAFKDNLQYACEIRDDVGTGYHRGESVGVGQLAALFDLQTAGFLIIGEAMKALDEEEPLLGAAFYLLLGRALRRRMPIYDHFAAEWYNEQLHDMMADDDPDNQESYEFPPVEEATPPSVKIVDGWNWRTTRKLLRKHRKGPYAAWIEKLFTIERLSRLKCDTANFGGEYDREPVPSVLIVFRENDAVQACWDHEAEHYNEASNEPACAVVSRPDDPDQFDRALRTMYVFLKMNMELAELVNLLNDWEAKHARGREHRAEPALRAA